MAGRWRNVLLVAALALSACTDGDDRDAAVDDTTTTTAPTPGPVELSIDGDGFLLLRQHNQHVYARSATFTVDALGKLATAAGDLLQGWPAAADGTIDVNGPTTDVVIPVGEVTIDAEGMITGDDDGHRIGQVTVALFGNPDGLEQLAGPVFRPTSSSGLSTLSTPGIEGRGSVVATSA